MLVMLLVSAGVGDSVSSSFEIISANNAQSAIPLTHILRGRFQSSCRDSGSLDFATILAPTSLHYGDQPSTRGKAGRWSPTPGSQSGVKYIPRDPTALVVLANPPPFADDRVQRPDAEQDRDTRNSDHRGRRPRGRRELKPWKDTAGLRNTLAPVVVA